MRPPHFWLGTLLLALVFVLPATPSEGSDGPGDELLVSGETILATAPLPRGPARPDPLALSERMRQLTVLPDGRLVGIYFSPDNGELPQTMMLGEIGSDGEVTPIGAIELDPRGTFGEYPVELAVDATGRLYMLSQVSRYWNPPDVVERLVHLDPDDASTLSSLDVPFATGPLATAPEGFWSLGGPTLQRLDPDTGELTDAGVPMGSVGGHAAATDSTGALWIATEGVCSVPCFAIHRFDPATGSLRPAPVEVQGNVFARDLAIRRGCVETPTARCLQGGRFRAEVSWRDFQDRSGPGRAVPARSADTALFRFFDPANWELMVKVLDGCGSGGHYWVFASASTNVEYTLTVTDLETGAARSYDNPLGQVAETVTDTSAFPCP